MFQVSRLPQLIEAQIQPSSKVAVGFTQEVWNVLAVMPDEGKLLEQNEKMFSYIKNAKQSDSQNKIFKNYMY